MGKKKEYKEANRRFLKKLSFQEGVCALPCGIYYKVLETGESTISPGARSIVTVHYKGSLIDGRGNRTFTSFQNFVINSTRQCENTYLK
jgi:peptidylprolyl isomerase